MIYRAVCKQFAASEPLLASAVAESTGARVDGSPGSAGWILRHAMDAVLQGRGRKCGMKAACINYIAECRAKWVTALSVASAPSVQTKPLRWHVLNDVVMGGQSKSRVVATEDGSLEFSGEISLIGGGFASCRTLIDGKS